MLKFREPILAGYHIMTDSIQKQFVCLGRLFYGEWHFQYRIWLSISLF